MQKLFNKILVPVDFSTGSTTLLEKATDIALQYKCSIQLLHVLPYQFSPPLTLGTSGIMIPDDTINNKKELEIKMDNLCASVSSIQQNGQQPGYSILKGTWDEAIIDMVKQNKYDLVLIGQSGSLIRKRTLHINPDNVATIANVPVITVPLERRLTGLYSIVIPVTDFLPIKKLIYGIYLSHQFNTTLKLLGVENKKTSVTLQYYLSKAYYLVKDNCNVPVELEIITGNNVAEAVNEFANLHAADLIIMNPGTQTRMPGFFSKLLNNILHKYSALPVLTINPV